MPSDLADVCRLFENPEELETVELILRHCPRLQNSNLGWLDSKFLSELGDVSDCGLENLSFEKRWHFSALTSFISPFYNQFIKVAILSGFGMCHVVKETIDEGPILLKLGMLFLF